MKAYTCFTVDDVDYDDVQVEYEIERPEPDVNFAGGVVINSLWHNGKDITNLLSDRGLDGLADTIILETDDDGYGDYLYDMAKDYAAEQAITARALAADPDWRWK